tara:strand:- start:152 stop:1123 length:972 start_codon:yes stop_codon:yes gene_type:complete
MNVAQRSASVTGLGATLSAYHTVDRFPIAVSTSGRLTMTQTADGPNGISANCTKFDCTTADTSIAAGEYFLFRQLFEGQNLQRIGKGVAGAQQITISFYVKANAAFTFGCELEDKDNNRNITILFDTTTDWVRKVITIPADVDDGSSPFDDDNAESLRLNIWLHAGSTYTSGTLGTSWYNRVDANRAVGIDSFFSSTDNNFFITGVQMEVGPVATEFEQEDISTTLQKCQRYFETGKAGATGNHPTADTGFFGGVVHYKVDKRAAATLAQSGQSYRELENDTIYLGSVGQQYALNVVNGFAHDAIHDGANCKYIFTYTADAEL